MKIVTGSGREYERTMKRIDARMESGPTGVRDAVERIIRNVRRNGNAALLSYTKRFDNVALTPRTMRVNARRIKGSYKRTDPAVVAALHLSANRIRAFHDRQKERSWSFRREGATLGQNVRPLAAAGLYVPGGKASYPSSVLMNAIPAGIAGVRRVVMVTPAPHGELNPYTLVAADIAGVDEIYTVGGAQAVAALAYGTETIEPVDKIVGPGNVYVAEAKRQVFGRVDIDMIAGPSEILVLADDTANPAHVAADLLSQAEHDENAYPILVTTSRRLAENVARELKTQTGKLKRAAIVRACLRKNCFAFVVKNLDRAFELSNRIAPEHFELVVKDAAKQAARVENAGALFIGPWSTEALGDYVAGCNHVLPTGGTARFSSPLGVYDFLKKTSVMSFTRKGMESLAGAAAAIARIEGLQAHANAIDLRRKK